MKFFKIIKHRTVLGNGKGSYMLREKKKLTSINGITQLQVVNYRNVIIKICIRIERW